MPDTNKDSKRKAENVGELTPQNYTEIQDQSSIEVPCSISYDGVEDSKQHKEV